MLGETCHKAHLSYISVPKRSDKIQIDDEIYKIEQYIEKVFIVKEQAYLKKVEENPELTKKPFYQRVRATYCNQNREVTLLFLRFNGSKKCLLFIILTKLFLLRHSDIMAGGVPL